MAILPARCAKRPAPFFSVELDRTFREYLEPLVEQAGNLTVVYDDILRVPLSRFASHGKIKVVANIPYGITGPILFKLIHERALVESAFLTTQKEIGQRVVSLSHQKSYGALSVICQLTAETKILLNLKPGVFIPPPKVDSVYFSLIFREDSDYVDGGLIEFIKHCFEHKRKYLSHALSKYYENERISALYDAMGFIPSVRAEEINPGGFVEMYRQLHGPGLS